MFRYDTGNETLTERQSTGKPHEIPAFVKTMAQKTQDIQRRLNCFVCKKDAVFWCVECAQNYCKYCWNSIGHHEFVRPDEVWNNRKPSHAIDYNPNDEAGMQVYLTPGDICQGRMMHRAHTSSGADKVRPVSPPLQTLNFPPPDGISGMDGGYNYEEYSWATLDNKKAYSGKAAGSTGIRTGSERAKQRSMKLNVTLPSASDLGMQDLMTAISPPKSRPPPGQHLQKSPIKSFSPKNNNDSPSSRSPTRSPTSSPKKPSSPTSSPLKKLPSQESPLKESPIRSTSPAKPYIPVVMEPVPNQTLMWQVSLSGRSLCPVSTLTPGKLMKPARGITKELFPEEWQAGRDEVRRELKVYNGVTVVTRKCDPAVVDVVSKKVVVVPSKRIQD
jgi:hypothetical protein